MFKVDQKVVSISYGPGKVISVNEGSLYSINVAYDNYSFFDTFTSEGKLAETDYLPSLYSLETMKIIENTIKTEKEIKNEKA